MDTINNDNLLLPAPLIGPLEELTKIFARGYIRLLAKREQENSLSAEKSS